METGCWVLLSSSWIECNNKPASEKDAGLFLPYEQNAAPDLAETITCAKSSDMIYLSRRKLKGMNAMLDIFDILGPVMVGPSSSHTAGAVKIGYVARKLMAQSIKKAEIL